MLSNRSRVVAVIAAILLCTGLLVTPSAQADDGTTVIGWWKTTVDFFAQLILPPEGDPDPEPDPEPDPCDIDPDDPDCPTTGDSGGDVGGWADPDG